MASNDYINLINNGINPRVAKELCSLFNTGNVYKELDNRAIDALKECNVNEAVRAIKSFSKLFRSSNAKSKSDYLCGMIKLQQQTQTQASLDAAMTRNQREHSPETQSNIQPGGQGWQQYTKLYQGEHQDMYPNHWYKQQMYPDHWYNQQQIYPHHGYNQEQNPFQGYHQNPYQFTHVTGYQPPIPVQYDQGLPKIMHGPLFTTPYMHQPQQNVPSNLTIPFPVSSDGAIPGQGPAPYPLSLTDQLNPTQLQQANVPFTVSFGGTPPGQGPPPYCLPLTTQYNPTKLHQEDEHLPDVNDTDVVKFLIKCFGGGCTFEDFLSHCDLFPKESDIRQWFRKHSKQFHVFWDGEDIIYLQPFFQDVKICVRWNNETNPGQCENAECNCFHICRRFIRDNCKTSNCPLLHSFRNPHNLYLKDKLGISDFVDTDIITVLKCNFPSVCADYIYNNGCKVENAEKRCPHLHLCQLKVFGKCENPCKFKKTHSITQFHNKWVLTSCHMKGWTEARLFRAIYVPPRQKEVREDISDLSQDKEDGDDVSVCYDSNVYTRSKSLPISASDPTRKAHKFITSVENLNIDGGKTKYGRRERFKLSRYINHGFLQIENFKQENHGTSSDSLLTSPLLCDGLYIDCIPDKRLDSRPFFTNVKEKDTKCLLSELEQTQTHEFARLVSTSNYFKTRKSLESKALNQLLRYAILHGSSLMCRLILSFITYNVKPEPYLIQMIFLALEKVEKDCARAISWFITRAFYLQYQSLMKELIDIWPSFCCQCSKGSNLSACSTDVVIVVELRNNCPNLPEEFCQLKIISSRNDDILHSDRPYVNDKLNIANGSLHLQDNVTVSSIAAKNLFTKHSNLTLICKSFRKSTGYKDGILEIFFDAPCVQLYCKAKGCIPIGEDHFPEVVCGLPTEILQGAPSLMANLKIGDKIGIDNYKTGTLGGFVKVRGDICFLTCLHVFLSAEDLASDNIALDDDAGVLVKCHRTRSDTGQVQMNSYNCGKIREIAFEMDNEKETSIDAALITINDGIQIDENDYLASNQPFPSIDIGMKSKYLNENCVDFKPLCYSIPCQNVKVVAVGAMSGINKSETQVKENNEKIIELESMEQTFNNVILGEVKEKVGDVIKQLISVDYIPPERISLVVEQVCTKISSNECKSVIMDVAKSILPIMKDNSYKKMNTNDNNSNEDSIFCSQCDCMYQPACECVDRIMEKMIISRTTSHLSAINSDVHMQHTYLKKTLDQQSLKRTSRRVFNQIHISNIPFKPGDSGTCIYTVQPSAGCIGMAIANHPQSGCIATPIKEILKHFKIKIK